MELNEDFACTLASLILVDDDVAITAEKLIAILKAAAVEIEPIWPKLFAEKLGANVRDLITSVGSAASVASAPVAAAPAAAAAADKKEAKEEKKEEKEEEEEDDDMGFGLFD
uniref:Large ribosomal subunit protein P1 n=1 Tax=Hirudo medicinalis TaxID=6421 RepID=K0KVY4_HIRME|nr:putative ribosomal protein P1 [Hirudo medicinalis]